jgi:hypothetical protein
MDISNVLLCVSELSLSSIFNAWPITMMECKMLRIHVQSPENRYFVTARLLITIGCNVVMLFIQMLEDYKIQMENVEISFVLLNLPRYFL